MTNLVKTVLAGICGLTSLSVNTACAQTAQMIPRKTVTFNNRKTVMGLPITKNTHIKSYCANDGTSFIDVYPGVDGPSLQMPDLYSVSSSGSAQIVQRLMPHESGPASEAIHSETRVLDFYIGDRTLVTLVEYRALDDNASAAQREAASRYYVSRSDLDGGSAKLVQLDLRFKPLKAALFSSGDLLILGWDPINLLPVLAIVKEDGTLRHFIDISKHGTQNSQTYISQQEAEHSAQTQSLLSGLLHAVFVPFGNKILLTYPGSARPIHALSDGGEDGTIPIAYPYGLLLHDAIVSGNSYMLVLRLQEPPRPPSDAVPNAQSAESAKPDPPKLRLFDFIAVGSSAGQPVKEYQPSPAQPEEVVCGVSYHLSALFWDTLADASAAAPAVGEKAGAAADNKTRLVISSAYR